MIGAAAYANKPKGKPKPGDKGVPKPAKSSKPGGQTAKPSIHGPLYTKQEAAGYLGVSDRTVDHLVSEGRLRKVRKRLGKCLFPQSELDRFIASIF